MDKNATVRAAILQAAAGLFQRYGINKTTMEDIARAAGKGKSTLYYYFKSRDEVLEAVALDQAGRITERIRSEIVKMDTAREKLGAYVKATFQGVREAIALYEIARGELRADKGLIAGVMGQFNAVHARLLASILRFGIERGEFKAIRAADIRRTGGAIQTVMRSLIINLFIDSDDLKAIDQIIRLLAKGL